MIVWRISSARWPEFDGEGARRAGGRWNRPGLSIVYTAGSLSLAALERFVNLDPEEDSGELIARSAEVPNTIEIERVERRDLPTDWREYPAPDSLADIGSAWVEGGKTAVLSVPSTVIPEESNYLLNPAHSAFRRIRVNQAIPFHFDPRMWKTRPVR